MRVTDELRIKCRKLDHLVLVLVPPFSGSGIGIGLPHPTSTSPHTVHGIAMWLHDSTNRLHSLYNTRRPSSVQFIPTQYSTPNRLHYLISSAPRTLLKETLVRHRFTFESESDTEVIPKLAKSVFDKANEGEGEQHVTFSQVVVEVMGHLEGAYALIFKS